MFQLAKGHEKGTLALLTIIPLFLFYGLVYSTLLLLIPIILAILIFHLFFYRDPSRTIIPEDFYLFSPADGVIYEVDSTNGIVRIRMSLLSVHVTRVPVSGVITSIEEEKGKHWPFFSFLPHGTKENQRQNIEIDSTYGKIRVTQIAGMIARKCTIFHPVQSQVIQGQRLGIIHYGSEVDLFYPPEKFQVLIHKGSKTIAGVTRIAKKLEN